MRSNFPVPSVRNSSTRPAVGDPELRAEVASLIEAAQQTAWLDTPALVPLEVHDEIPEDVVEETLTEDDPHAAAVSVALLAGKKFGAYLILGKLGEGGMGVVYHATDSRLCRPVALKLLSHADANEHDRTRFAREAHAASALNHPNIATIYEFDRRAGTDFIAMEYVEGTTLRAVLHDKKTPLPQLLEYAAWRSAPSAPPTRPESSTGI
jgi:serine/threonine protein kinase